MADTAPAVFFGHGSPMNAIETNRYSAAWSEFGATIAKPRAVLMVSAHWFTRGTAVTAMSQPRTIHDFGGFPVELFAVQYPAPGDPDLATQVAALAIALAGPGEESPVALDRRWGLDHGAWSVLVHVFPDADVPVVQLSIDGTKPPSWHWDLAERLNGLRDEGIMIVGSGNITHNFAELDSQATRPAPWAVEFDEQMWQAVQAGERAPLVGYEALADGLRAAPTADHFLPLVYVAAQRRPTDTVRNLVDGMDLGSFSMRSFSLS